MNPIKNEEDRKRFFSRCGLFTGITVCLIFFPVEIHRGNTAKALQNLGEGLFLLSIFLLSLRAKRKKPLYILGLASISLLLLYNAYWGVDGETSLIWSLILPLIFAFYRGMRRGLLWLLAYTLLLIPSLFGLIPGLPYVHDIPFALNFIIAYFIISSLSFSLEYSRARHLEYLNRYNSEMETAVKEIGFLQGILPVCSYCKKVRDDRGYWNQVENYLTRHSGVLISHSICPDCLEAHFPEEFEDIKDEEAVTDKG